MKEIEIDKGMSIHNAAQFAVDRARWEGETVMFKFNDICLCVHPKSHVDDIGEIYQLKHRIRATRGMF